MWRILADCPQGAIIDTWINTVRGDNKQVEIELQKLMNTRVCEIFCKIPGDTAVERYAKRQRNSVHRADAQILEEIRNLADQLRPLDIGPTFVVDTSSPVDPQSIIEWLNNIDG